MGSSPVHHILVNPDVRETWWKRGESQKKNRQNKKDDGERMAIIFIIRFVINYYNNYLHLSRISTFMVSFTMCNNTKKYTLSPYKLRYGFNLWVQF